jgi:hypothetical protein
MKKLKKLKGKSEAENRRTDNTMDKRKKTTIIYKALHTKLKNKHHEAHLKPEVNSGASEG